MNNFTITIPAKHASEFADVCTALRGNGTRFTATLTAEEFIITLL